MKGESESHSVRKANFWKQGDGGALDHGCLRLS